MQEVASRGCHRNPQGGPQRSTTRKQKRYAPQRSSQAQQGYERREAPRPRLLPVSAERRAKPHATDAWNGRTGTLACQAREIAQPIAVAELPSSGRRSAGESVAAASDPDEPRRLSPNIRRQTRLHRRPANARPQDLLDCEMHVARTHRLGLRLEHADDGGKHPVVPPMSRRDRAASVLVLRRVQGSRVGSAALLRHGGRLEQGSQGSRGVGMVSVRSIRFSAGGHHWTRFGHARALPALSLSACGAPCATSA